MLGFDPVFELSSLNGANGFQIDGEAAGDRSGKSVASAGDVNGDGFDDLIIGAYHAGAYSGASYVVFGQAEGFAAGIDLSDLDGTNGFQISGEATFDLSGACVASAGDVNGDGFDDLIIGAPHASPNGQYSGASYVVFGQAGGFAAEIELSDLDGTDGFQISGEEAFDLSGGSVALAGDVNGDGFDDLIIGTTGDAGGVADSYVVFGQAGGFAPDIDLSALNGTDGFQISGFGAGGLSVASAGDVNGDGLDDLIIGADLASPSGSQFQSGASYVIFGQAGGFAADIGLADLDGANGFQVNGEVSGDLSGGSVASAGDLNGDGFDDLIVGAIGAEPNGRYSGASYVVFGHAGSFAAEIELSSLDGTGGFQVSGEAAYDLSGWSVASAGDVNGDGFDDLIIGAWGADSNGSTSGASYVVFGQAGGFAADVDLSDLNGSSGFKIIGEAAYDLSGWSVASAGDVNGDGFDDLIIGAPDADLNGSEPGASYVVFGQATAAVDRIGTNDADLLVGGDFDDTLDGRGGDDIIDGRGGNDHLDGGTGADAMTGSAGDDTYVVDDAGDTTTEAAGGGIDTVQSSVTLTLAAEIENLTLTGSAAISGTGSDVANVLTGNGAANTLSGLGGSDRLDGGADADAMSGGTGNDTYVVDNAGDTVSEVGGGGSDTVEASVTFSLGGGLNNLILTGTANINGTGTGSANTLIGNAGNNKLDGRGGADTMSGGAGNDTYIVDSTDDVLMENPAEGRDTVEASITFDLAGKFNELTLTGTANINGTGTISGNVLKGNSGRNTLDGKGGEDTLNGGDGNDSLIGGDDADVFVFGDNDGDDVIADFENGSDLIDLSAVDDVSDFRDLVITDTGGGVLIDYGNGTIELEDVASAASIDGGDFVFI